MLPRLLAIIYKLEGVEEMESGESERSGGRDQGPARPPLNLISTR